MKKLVLLFLIPYSLVNAQSITQLGTYFSADEQRKLYLDSTVRQTSIRPYTYASTDSAWIKANDALPKGTGSWTKRKLFSEHLLQGGEKEWRLYADFLPEWGIGKQVNGNNLWINTRGVVLGGHIGNQIRFYTTIYENQAAFPSYLVDNANKTSIIPGQGEARVFGKSGYAFDYGYSQGRIAYIPSKYIAFELGNDKNFIGDGYRSLILSDVSFNYPFFKMTTTLGKFRYMIMWSQMINKWSSNGSNTSSSIYGKKWGVFHYLNWDIDSKFSVGIFENIIWKNTDDSGNYRGFEFNYANPLLFFRPTEYSLNSPDKVILGSTAKWKPLRKSLLYGQFVLNEFTAKEFFANNGYWANKWAVQIGSRSFDIFSIHNLDLQIEHNRATPYTYSSLEKEKSYSHYGQALAHPLGANFKESIAIISYRYQRWSTRLEFLYASYGLDTESTGTTSYGQDIFRPYTDRVSDYGVYTGQGLKTKLYYGDVKISYLLNPVTNLRVEASLTLRRETNSEWTNNASIFNIGIKSSLRNIYYDL